MEQPGRETHLLPSCTGFCSLIGQTADQPVKVGSISKESVREAELDIEESANGSGTDDEVVIGEQVATLVPLDAVTQLHGYVDGPSIRGHQSFAADCEQVANASQRHGHGV